MKGTNIKESIYERIYYWENKKYFHKCQLPENIDPKEPSLGEAKRFWTDQTDKGMTYYVGLTSMTEEETVEYNTLYTAVQTLVTEKTVKDIMGTESLDTYDDFIDSLYDYGIERCIEIKQAVYDRYQARGNQ